MKEIIHVDESFVDKTLKSTKFWAAVVAIVGIVGAVVTENMGVGEAAGEAVKVLMTFIVARGAQDTAKQVAKARRKLD